MSLFISVVLKSGYTSESLENLFKYIDIQDWAWWLTPVIPALQGQGGRFTRDQKFKTNLGNIGSAHRYQKKK